MSAYPQSTYSKHPLIDPATVTSTPRTRLRADELKKNRGEYDKKAKLETVNDINKALEGELMDSILEDAPNLIEKRFPAVLFQRLRGQHGSISLANDPDFPNHKDLKDFDSRSGPVVQDGGSHVHAPSQGPIPSDRDVFDGPSIHDTDSSRPHPSNESATPPTPCPILDEIFTDMTSGSDKLYDSVQKKWLRWPETNKPGKEEVVCKFLNEILARARRFLYGSDRGPEDSTEWIFSAKYANVMMKLDGVDPGPWRAVRSVGELRSTDYQNNLQLAKGRLAQYSRLMYGSHEGRRFTLLFSLIDDNIALYKYDRSGVLISKVYNVHHAPMTFMRIIVGLALGEDYFLGFDPSFFSRDGKDYVELNDKAYEIVEVIYRHSVIRGRGSVVLHVIDEETGEDLAIKDQWVDTAREKKEDYWLRLLEARNAQNVARLVDHQLVRFEVGDEGIVNDDTASDREDVPAELKEGIEIREHRRIGVTPFGVNLKYFRSLKELVSVFRDFAEGIRSIYKADVFHRDISRHNLIIARKPDEPIGKGYVIDLDCAASVNHQRSGVAELTGTIPFMAISILKNNGCPHKYYYEMESLFYALVWTCVTENGPRQNGRPPYTFDFKKSPVAAWCGPKIDELDDEATVYMSIAGVKTLMLTDFQNFEDRIVSHIPPYFKPILEMLRNLRRLLFQPKHGIPVPEELMPISQRKDVDKVFQTFISILNEALEQLVSSSTDPENPVSTNDVQSEKENDLQQPTIAEPDVVERAANRRRMHHRKRRETPIAAAKAKLAGAGGEGALHDETEDLDAQNDPQSPSPSPTKGSNSIYPPSLDLSSRISSRIAGSHTTVSSHTAVSHTAVSWKTTSFGNNSVSARSRGPVGTRGTGARRGSRRGAGSLGGGSRGVGSRDTSSVGGKRSVPEGDQSHSSSKRRRG
ncbi:hypothetical protein ACEPAF_1953 [Sanghuangporus sanghuang]